MTNETRVHPAIAFYQWLTKYGLRGSGYVHIGKNSWSILDGESGPTGEEVISMTPATLKTLVEAAVEAALRETLVQQDFIQQAPSLRRPEPPEVKLLTAADLKIGGHYNWKNQSERLIYLGKKGSWHQFDLISPELEQRVWCEILSEDIGLLEETC